MILLFCGNQPEYNEMQHKSLVSLALFQLKHYYLCNNVGKKLQCYKKGNNFNCQNNTFSTKQFTAYDDTNKAQSIF